MSTKISQDLSNYPEIDGRAIFLAREIAAVIFPECVMIFFDDSVEPTGNYSECENIGALNRATISSLFDNKTDSDKWNTLEEARTAAQIGLRKKDGKKIQWN